MRTTAKVTGMRDGYEAVEDLKPCPACGSRKCWFDASEKLGHALGSQGHSIVHFDARNYRHSAPFIERLKSVLRLLPIVNSRNFRSANEMDCIKIQQRNTRTLAGSGAKVDGLGLRGR